MNNDNQSDSSNQPLPKKHYKKVVTIALVTIVSLAAIIGVGILVFKSSSPHIAENKSPNFPQDKHYPEKISASEKQKVSQEVISKLEKKYGSTTSFQVVNMEKGEYHISDVAGPQSYFNIKMRIKSPEIEADFSVNYLNRTDDVWSKMQDKYKNSITNGFKAVNSSVSTVSYSLSDYNGNIGDNVKDFESIDTQIGHIPTQKEVELLIQSISISYEHGNSANKYKNGIDEFVASKKPEVKTLYAYITQTFPRIPKGIGATSAEIDFGNAVTIRIFPLAKDILIIEQSNSVESVGYKWEELVN